MTGKQLYDDLVNFGIDVDEALVVGWINIAQKKVCLEYPIKKSLTVIVAAGGVVDVPTSVLSVISAVFSDGTTYPLSSITVSDKSLTFLLAGTVTVVITTLTDDYSNITSELQIHPALHAPFFYYILSMYYHMDGEGDDEESSLAEKFYQRWIYYKNLAMTALNNSSNPSPSMDPVDTVDAMPRRSYRAITEGDYYE